MRDFWDVQIKLNQIVCKSPKLIPKNHKNKKILIFFVVWFDFQLMYVLHNVANIVLNF